MLTAKIHSIGSQYIMEDEDFEWLQRHLDEPLAVMALNFTVVDGSKPWMLTVYRTNDRVISLFIDSQQITYTLGGTSLADMSNAPGDVLC